MPALCQGLEQALRANPSLSRASFGISLLLCLDTGMRFPSVHATSDTHSVSFLLPLSSSQGCFVPSLPVPAPKAQGWLLALPAALSTCAHSLGNPIIIPRSGNFSQYKQLYILQSPPPACAVPKQVALVPPRPNLSCILPSVCHQPLSPLSEAQPQPSLPQLEPPSSAAWILLQYTFKPQLL